MPDTRSNNRKAFEKIEGFLLLKLGLTTDDYLGLPRRSSSSSGT